MRSGEVLDGVVRRLRRQLGDGPTDGELLAQFANSRDEAAFEALVRRHGGLVFGVARRQLGDRQSAEDVFQTTFLALAGQAARLGRPVSLVNWLYTVSLRQARKARLAAMRRTARHNQLPPTAPRPDPLSEITARELLAVIDDELARLPEPYRLPLLLCAIEGLSREEAAARLGWSPGAVKGRLERGRELLRARLEARGLAVPAVMASLLMTDAYAAPPALIAATSRAAVAALTAPAAWGSLKLLTAFAALFTGIGTVALVAQASRERERPEFEAPQPPLAHAPGSPQVPPRVDRDDAPPPAGVLRRLGSTRMRQATSVTHLVVSPDGKRVASAGWDGVRVWELSTGKLTWHAPGQFIAVAGHSLGFSADGREVLIVNAAAPGGGPPGLRRFDVATGREALHIKGRANPGHCVSPSGRYFTSLDADNSLSVHNTKTGLEVSRLPGLWDSVRDVHFSADDRIMALARRTDTIWLFDTTAAAPIGELKRENARFASVELSPEGDLVAALNSDERLVDEVHLWKVRTQRYLGRLQTRPTDRLVQFQFSPDGKTLAAANRMGGPATWDCTTLREVRRFSGVKATNLAQGAIRIAFAADGKTLVAGTATGTILLWDIATGRLLPSSADPHFGIEDLRYSNEGRRLVGRADRFFAWDPRTGREVERYADVPTTLGDIALSPDHRLLAGANSGDTLCIWDATNGGEIRKFAAEKTLPWGVPVFTPDGRRLITAAADANVAAKVASRIVVWDVASGRLLATMNASATVFRLTVSPDGRWLASVSPSAVGDGDNTVRVWDLTTYAEAQRFRPPASILGAAAFSRDSRRLAAVGRLRNAPSERTSFVHVWDLETGREVRAIDCPNQTLLCAAMSPDGRTLATGNYDGVVQLWELVTGRERHRFSGHAGYVESLAFAPDGKTLAAASYEAPVYIWDVYGVAEPGKPLTPAESDQSWKDIMAPEAEVAFRAIRRLVAAGESAVALVRERLQPAAATDPKLVQDMIRKLDSERFAARQKAAGELEKLGDRAAAELRAALKDATTAEARQALQRLLDRIDAGTPETLRAIRAVEVLEHIATPAAREHLKTLAGGQPGAEPTVAAIGALKRLSH